MPDMQRAGGLAENKFDLRLAPRPNVPCP
jgi:hypothetical protein